GRAWVALCRATLRKGSEKNHFHQRSVFNHQYSATGAVAPRENILAAPMHLFPSFSEREPETEPRQAKIPAVFREHVTGVEEHAHRVDEPVLQARAGMKEGLLNR